MKKLSLFLLAVISTAFFNSCSKEDEGAKPISFTTEKTQYAPYEFATITSSVNLFTSKSFVAKINDVEVMVGTDENSASFVLPNLPNGNYDLIFSVNENTYSVPINIKALSNILSADQYFNEIQSGLYQNINDLNSQITQLEQNSSDPNEYENLKNDILKYTTQLNDYTTSYHNLSDIEKQEFAKTIAANKALGDDYNQLILTLNSSTSSLRTAQSVQDYESKVELASLTFYSCVNEIAQQIPCIVAGAIIAKTPIHPFINAGAILATGILVARFMVNVDKTIKAAITLTDKSIKPFEFITQTDDIQYDSGVETDTDNSIRYRSIINSDSNGQVNKVSANNTAGNGSTITTIAQKYNLFKEKYNNLINELPSFFRPSYIMKSLKNTYKSTSRSVHNKYINISNSSNPQVKLEQLNQPDGSIKIKATTTASTNQTFTYDVFYGNSNLASGLKKTVSATVLPGDSLLSPCDDTTAPYPTVTIGSQVWMQKNLNACKYRNGDPIPQVQDRLQWSNLTTGAWCYYENKTDNGIVYGKLYNWYAVNDPRGLAPVGWHIPIKSEWTTLTESFIGKTANAGYNLKEAGTLHWINNNLQVNNSSGFTALPGGERVDSGYFGISSIGDRGYWWSSTVRNTTEAEAIMMYSIGGDAVPERYAMGCGFSVRCIKD